MGKKCTSALAEENKERYLGPSLDSLPKLLAAKIEVALEVMSRKDGLLLEATVHSNSWPSACRDYDEIYKTDFGCFLGYGFRDTKSTSYTVKLKTVDGAPETDREIGSAFGLNTQEMEKICQPEPGILYFGKK